MGSTVVWWLVLLSHCKKVLSSAPPTVLGHFCVKFACIPMFVLVLSPASSHSLKEMLLVG